MVIARHSGAADALECSVQAPNGGVLAQPGMMDMTTSQSAGRRLFRRAFGLLICGCSAAGSGRQALELEADSASPPGVSAANSDRVNITPTLGGMAPPLGANAGMTGGEAACAPESVELQGLSQPVDIIIAVDNSGSMEDTARAVEAHLNASFAAILGQNQVDYRLILVSEHRQETDQDAAVCIVGPLSALEECPSDGPGPSERFFQYSTDVGSDSFEVLLESLTGELADDFDLAPSGWSTWLRAEARKVFIGITNDDDSTTALEFAAALTSVAPEQFGSDLTRLDFVWHSIVGLAGRAVGLDPYVPSDPIEDEECEGDVSNAGSTYQELSRLTGGLRFPICALDSYGAIFERMASDLVASNRSSCDFALPAPPPGGALDLDQLALSYQPSSGGETRRLGQVRDPLACKPDAFLLDASGVHLCAGACDAVRADREGSVDAVFTCQSTLLP